jgi:hypothetical protein
MSPLPGPGTFQIDRQLVFFAFGNKVLTFFYPSRFSGPGLIEVCCYEPGGIILQQGVDTDGVFAFQVANQLIII